MKKKELKELAKKIAKAEYIVQHSEDQDAIKRAQGDIIELSGHVLSLEDMMIVDEIVQEILNQKS